MGEAQRRSSEPRPFSPHGVFWQVNREMLMVLSGSRAVLLELAHPLIAEGVASHSDFRKNRFHRLFRSLRLMVACCFSDPQRVLDGFGLEANPRTAQQTLAVLHAVRRTLPDVLFHWPQATLAQRRYGVTARAGVWALVNNIPRPASLSMFGVLACGCPPSTPTQSFKSSTAMNRMSGRLWAEANTAAPNPISR